MSVYENTSLLQTPMISDQSVGQAIGRAPNNLNFVLMLHVACRIPECPTTQKKNIFLKVGGRKRVARVWRRFRFEFKSKCSRGVVNS